MFRPIEKSQTLLLNEQSRAQESQGRTVYKLGFGQSPFLPPQHVREALAASAHRKDYTAVRGLSELCERFAHFYRQTEGVSIKPSQVMIAPGSKILLYNSLLAFESAHVCIPAPAWVSYAPQAKLAGHQAHTISSSFALRWRVTTAALEECLSRCGAGEKIVILNYPGNPDGLTYSEEELRALADVLHRHRAWVLSDEIYGLLHHRGEHVSLARFYPERTLVTTGLSKWCGAGGWRLGVQVIPEDAPQSFIDALLGVASETYSCAPTPVQLAACAAYAYDTRIEQYLNTQRSILSVLGNHIQTQLSSAGIAVHAPEGGFYLLVDFSPFAQALRQAGMAEDISLCSTLMAETGVALLPGSAFGMAKEDYTARLAYVDFDGETLLQMDRPAPDQIIGACTHMMQGIEKLAGWAFR